MKLLTVDCGIFSRGDNLMTGLVARLHPITIPCWNLPGSFEQPVFVGVICVLAMEVAELPE